MPAGERERRFERRLCGAIRHPVPRRLGGHHRGGDHLGMEQAHRMARRAHGRALQPLARLLEDDPLRGHGIAVTQSQGTTTPARSTTNWGHPWICRHLPVDGRPPLTGAVFRQPRMGATLASSSRAGLDDFYRGDLARSIARDLAAAGSRWRSPTWKRIAPSSACPWHRTGRVYNMPPPTQGPVSLMILGQMDRLGIGSFDHLGADFVHAAVEATKRAFLVRDRHITGPQVMKQNGAPDPQSRSRRPISTPMRRRSTWRARRAGAPARGPPTPSGWA